MKHRAQLLSWNRHYFTKQWLGWDYLFQKPFALAARSSLLLYTGIGASHAPIASFLVFNVHPSFWTMLERLNTAYPSFASNIMCKPAWVFQAWSLLLFILLHCLRTQRSTRSCNSFVCLMIKFTFTLCPECFCSIIDLACDCGPGIRQNTWAHFDYFPRTERNMMAYNQPTPPSYEPAQIPATIPVLIILGGQDWTAPPHGINMFMTQLQQVPHVVNLTKYAHYDLIFSATRENDVYLPILSFLESSLFT